MIIDCLADLHGHYPNLQGGDMLIVAGDLTGRNSPIEYGHFGCWMDRQKYKKKILIAGNHDNYFETKGFEFIKDVYKSIDVEYLCDSETEFEGIKIWGSPWTSQFPGINPHCCAFTMPFGCDTEQQLADKWSLIPADVDILITHSPAYGILDRISSGECVGSKSLQMELFTRLRPKLFVCGHIHEAYGIEPPGGIVEKAINASHVNEKYQPVNKPVRIILEGK